MDDIGERSVTDPEHAEVAGSTKQRSKFGVTGEVVALYAICLFVALALAAICVAATGGSWTNVYIAMLDGSIRKPGRWGTTLGVTAPILLVALGTIVNGRAGLVNIGQEGQLVMGSCLAAYVGVRLGGPGPFVLVIAMLFGIVTGTYSSIFIASPVLEWLGVKRDWSGAAAKPAGNAGTSPKSA